MLRRRRRRVVGRLSRAGSDRGCGRGNRVGQDRSRSNTGGGGDHSGTRGAGGDHNGSGLRDNWRNHNDVGRRLRMSASVLALAAGVGVGQREGSSDLGGRRRVVGDTGRFGVLNRAPSRVGNDNLGRDVANRAVGDRRRARGDGVHVGRGEGRGVRRSSRGTVARSRRGGGTSSSGALVRDNCGASVRDNVAGSAVGEPVGGRGLETAASRRRGCGQAGCRGGLGGGDWLGRGDGSRSRGGGHSRGGCATSTRASTGETSRDSVRAGADGDQVGAAVLVLGDVNVLVVPVEDDVGGSQESVAKNGEVIVLRDTELADAQVGLLPDEVVVVDADGGVAKLEVD